jgi:hypothetical protein
MCSPWRLGAKKLFLRESNENEEEGKRETEREERIARLASVFFFRGGGGVESERMRARAS